MLILSLWAVVCALFSLFAVVCVLILSVCRSLLEKTYCVAGGDLDLSLTLLPPPPECWSSLPVSPCLVYLLLGRIYKASCMLGNILSHLSHILSLQMQYFLPFYYIYK